jgi:naphthalene 1,2-dioxygenase system ferredoxin subunit
MTTHWTEVAALADLFDGAGIAVTPAGHDIALYSVDGAVYATDNLCTHGNARLCDGFIEGLEIECPFHQGRFDLRTGQPTCAPATEPLKTWPVKIDGDRVYLALD